MEKDFIDEFIPSKDTRAYLHSIHHEFTDLEKATIVANHLMISYEKKVSWLNAFMNKISDAALKDRISKALVQIKKDREYYSSCNTALGDLNYNESLFGFVFIPHNFRHGDIVRSLYGDWNTTEFCEKVGIILNYTDKDYEFYKHLKGDYSDVQVCVDIKFDGVAYQGEFHHEHINPIYIERLTLNEKDERRAYLSYLTNLYSKKNSMLEIDNNKPEYTGGSDDLLEQRYLGNYIPVQDEDTGNWCVQMGYGFESGDVGYIAAEFSGKGLIYHFMYDGEMDHVHSFDDVLAIVLQDTEHVDIVTDYGEYSEQEIQMVEGIKRAAAFVQAHQRPMTIAELRENRAEIKHKGDRLFLLYFPGYFDGDEIIGIYDDILKLKASYERVIRNAADEDGFQYYDIYLNNPNTKLTIKEFDRDNEKFIEVDPETLWSELNNNSH